MDIQTRPLGSVTTVTVIFTDSISHVVNLSHSYGYGFFNVSAHVRSFSGPHFPTFGVNTEI